MSNILLAILLLLIIGAFPVWPYSANWGYYPGSGFGILFVLAIVYIFSRPKSLR